jgi:hypothetical protein
VLKKPRFWKESKNLSLYGKFYNFRYEAPYEISDPSTRGSTFAYTRKFYSTSGKYGLKQNFCFF